MAASAKLKKAFKTTFLKDMEETFDHMEMPDGVREKTAAAIMALAVKNAGGDSEESLKKSFAQAAAVAKAAIEITSLSLRQGNIMRDLLATEANEYGVSGGGRRLQPKGPAPEYTLEKVGKGKLFKLVPIKKG
jgi:hypothetical protein